MSVSRETRKNRHEQAESPTLKRGNPSSNEGRVGTQQFRNIHGKGLVHMVRTEKGWNEMSTSQTSTTAGDKVDSAILTGSQAGGGVSGGSGTGVSEKNITNSYTGGDTSVQDVVFLDTVSNAYIRGVRSQNTNLSITVVDSLDYGSYINFNAISGTGIESVQSYSEVSNSYATAIGANTNLKFASDYDSGASTGIFFTASDSGNDTILTPTILFPPDTNTTYATSWVDSGDNAILRLTPSSGSNDDLTLVAGSNIYLTPSGGNMTIAANNTTNYSLVNSTGNPTGSHTMVMTSSGTEGRLRALKPGNNITMTTTDTDTDTSYVTLNADLSGATISTSEVNPLGGYLTYSASNMRFLDGTGITWALVNQGSGVIELTPTVTITDTNTQNVFASSWVNSSADVLLRLTKSGASSGTQDIKLVAGSNIYLTPSGTNMTIASNNTTNYSLVNSDKSSSHSFVMTNTGTEGRIRNIKAGSNITMTTTDDDTDTGYVTVNASLSNATINVSEVNPVQGYFTWDSANIRFIDNGGITWELGRPGSDVTTVTPSFTLPGHNHGATEITSGTIADARLPSDCGANTSYAASSHSHSYIATSHAANSITSTHITVLGNTSGTNSGDQTLPTRTSLGIDSDDAVTFGALQCPTLNTGQGAYELYAMNQDVETTDAVTFATVNTGQGANELYDMNQNVLTGSDVQFDSFGVGTAASGVTGEIRATNEVTAYYSDDRLKTRRGNIKKALEKVCSLNGFHYSPNELAGSLGYDTSEKKVGVSAQEVLKILPEAVTAAPIDPQYHAVQYDKLVPLLVEAIKELSERKCSCGV